MANNQGGACRNSGVGIFWGGQMDDNSTFAESVEKPGLAWNGRCFFATVRIVRIAGLVEGEALYPEKQGLQKWRACRPLFWGAGQQVALW